MYGTNVLQWRHQRSIKQTLNYDYKPMLMVCRGNGVKYKATFNEGKLNQMILEKQAIQIYAQFS